MYYFSNGRVEVLGNKFQQEANIDKVNNIAKRRIIVSDKSNRA